MFINNSLLCTFCTYKYVTFTKCKKNKIKPENIYYTNVYYIKKNTHERANIHAHKKKQIIRKLF